MRRGVGCERNNHADMEVSEDGEGGGVPEQRFPCSPSLQPVEDPTPQQVAGPGKDRDSVGESPCWSSLQRTAVRGKDLS